MFSDIDMVQDERKMALFAQYAMAASEEALEDADWKPSDFDQREATVMGLDCVYLEYILTDRPTGCLSWIRDWKL